MKIKIAEDCGDSKYQAVYDEHGIKLGLIFDTRLITLILKANKEEKNAKSHHDSS